MRRVMVKGSDDFTKKHPNIVKNCEAMIDLNCVGAGENIFLLVIVIDQNLLKETPTY
jgi:hypothetical protein